MLLKKQAVIIALLVLTANTYGTYSFPSSLQPKQHKCIPVEIEQCKQWYDSRRPLDMYRSTTREYETAKQLIQKLSTLTSPELKGCALDAVFMLCAMYSPVCFKDSSVLKPCRQMCVNWKKSCSKLNTFRNAAFPQEMKECDDLPEDHNSMCIQPNSFVTREQETKKQTTQNGKNVGDVGDKKDCGCNTSKQRLITKYRHFRKASYAFEAVLLSRETQANGNTKVLVNITNIFKQGRISLKRGKSRIWSPCFCFKDIQYGDKYFFLLSESSKRRKTEITKNSIILPYEEYKDKFMKWNEKCIKKKC